MSIGRNDPCGCGSGRKFKRCCGASAASRPEPSASEGTEARKEPAESVDPSVAVKLTGGDAKLAQSLFALQGLLAQLRTEVNAPGEKVWTVAADELANERAVARIKVGLVRQLLGVRLREQLLDVVDAINRSRTLSLAQAVRAAVETAGAIAYYRKKLLDCEGDVAALLKQLDRCLLGSRFHWDEWQSLFVPGKESELAEFTRRVGRERTSVSEDAPPSVMTFIDYLQRRWIELAKEKGRRVLPEQGRVTVIYHQLCDFVHPSVGTWKTYVDADEASFEVRVCTQSRMESVQFVWLFFGQFVTELSFIGYADLLELESSVGV